MRDVLDLLPFADDHTSHALDDAVEIIGILRGFCRLTDTDFLHDPALRLHLLASLHRQLRNDLLAAVLTAHHHGYTPTQIAILSDLP